MNLKYCTFIACLNALLNAHQSGTIVAGRTHVLFQEISHEEESSSWSKLIHSNFTDFASLKSILQRSCHYH